MIYIIIIIKISAVEVVVSYSNCDVSCPDLHVQLNLATFIQFLKIFIFMII